MSPPGQRTGPSVDTEAGREIQAAGPITSHSRRSVRFCADRVIDRRRTGRLLDQILGCDRYPDVFELYGRTPAALRALVRDEAAA